MLAIPDNFTRQSLMAGSSDTSDYYSDWTPLSGTQIAGAGHSSVKRT